MKFKADKYKSARGKSQLLKISCRNCTHHIAYYQKDGPGSLRRIYMDRILQPNSLSDNQYKNIKDLRALSCASCKEILGHPVIYKKEKRHAYRLFNEAFVKTIVNLEEINKEMN